MRSNGTFPVASSVDAPVISIGIATRLGEVIGAMQSASGWADANPGLTHII